MSGQGLPEQVFATPTALPRGPHRLSSDEVRASQRMRLMVAMTELVAANGLAGTTLTALLKRAGVSKSTFYEVFPDKLSCWLAASEHLIVVLLDRLVAVGEQAETWPAYIDGVIDVYLGSLESDRGVARALVLESDGAGPQARARIADAYLGVAAGLSERYRAYAAADPSLSPLPDRVFMGIVLGTRELVRHTLEVEDGPLTLLGDDLKLWVAATVAGARDLA